MAKQGGEVVKGATKANIVLDKSALNKFKSHAFAKNRHADLGFSVEEIVSKGSGLVEKNIHLLKEGNNAFLVKINGIQKSFRVSFEDGKVINININMYPGISNRVTEGLLINLSDVKW